MAEKDPYLVPGLVRGLAALRAFRPERPEQGLADIARALGVTRSAAFRTVHTLVAEGYLLEVPGEARYRLGPRVLGLSHGYQGSRALLEVAEKPLEALRDALDWSTHLGVLDRRHVLYLHRSPASDGLSSLVHVGSRLPAAQTAMGRLLLSRRTEREIRQAHADRPEAEALAALAARARDREAETVVHEGQFESGLTSVAAPVVDAGGAVVAAISATKLDGAATAGVRRRVLETARAIGRALGTG